MDKIARLEALSRAQQEKLILVLSRRGLEGTAEYPPVGNVLSGTVTGLPLDFSGENAPALAKDFDRTVDQYLAERG